MVIKIQNANKNISKTLSIGPLLQDINVPRLSFFINLPESPHFMILSAGGKISNDLCHIQFDNEFESDKMGTGLKYDTGHSFSASIALYSI